jgi:hypothetical protein
VQGILVYLEYPSTQILAGAACLQLQLLILHDALLLQPLILHELLHLLVCCLRRSLLVLP